MGLQRQWSESSFPEIKIFECPLCCCSPSNVYKLNKIYISVKENVQIKGYGDGANGR